MANFITYGNSFASGVVLNGLILDIDVNNPLSYSGSGNNLYDVSGSGFDYTLYNSPTYSTTNGKKLIFNALSQYGVELPNNLIIQQNDAYTVQALINLSSLSTILYPYFLTLKTDGIHNLKIAYGDSSISAAANTRKGIYFGVDNLLNLKTDVLISKDANHLITITFDGVNATDINSYKLTLNEVSTPVYSSIAFGGVTSNHNYIGRSFPNYSFQEFKGGFGRALVYNRKLTDSEITRNINIIKQSYSLG